LETKVISVTDREIVIVVASFEIKFGKINGKVRKTAVIQHNKNRITDGFIPKIYFDPAIKRARAIFYDQNRKK